MTRALAAKAVRMVGSAARILASLATMPSLIGTFKSSRIKTRLPDRSRLVIFLMFMASSAGVDFSQAAFIQASVVSSIRLEKPHSLSYQAHTLTSVP